MDTVITSVNTTATVNTISTTNSSDLANERRVQNACRQAFFRTFREKDAPVLDGPMFRYEDLVFFRDLYKGHLTKKSEPFPLSVQGEVEKYMSDRKILQARGDDLNTRDLRRYNELLENYNRLTTAIACLDRAILKRKIAYAEEKAKKRQEALAQGPVTQGIRQGAVWNKDRSVSRQEAINICGSEEKLSKAFEDCKIHSTKVLCIFSDRERLSYEKNGAAIRYIIEKRA